ncbi:MAG: molybdenum ABC transporter ATP-binding protein [Halioglobus sp.]
MNTIELNIDCSGAQNFSLQVDCNLPAQGVTAIYGPSGSGKTTLLDCIAGLREPGVDSLIRIGDQILNDRNVQLPPWRREVGYVFSKARLFSHLSVQSNLHYAIQRRRTPRNFTIDDVSKWLQLDTLLERAPDSLSAGQQQRVAIARALLSAPQILLLDEPFANLDGVARKQCIQLLQQLSSELDIPMLFVSHDIEEVSELADYLLLLEDGRVRSQGPLIELCSRLDSRLAQEERAAAILCAGISRHDGEYGLSELDVEGETITVAALQRPVGSEQRLRIPARDVSICRQRPTDSSILNILPVTVQEMSAIGPSSLTLRLALGTQYLLARITRKSAAKLDVHVGDKVYAQIKSVALVSAPADDNAPAENI